jgi:hypothetical protein
MGGRTADGELEEGTGAAPGKGARELPAAPEDETPADEDEHVGEEGDDSDGAGVDPGDLEDLFEGEDDLDFDDALGEDETASELPDGVGALPDEEAADQADLSDGADEAEAVDGEGGGSGSEEGPLEGEVKADCPHCGTTLFVPEDAESFICPTCDQVSQLD